MSQQGGRSREWDFIDIGPKSVGDHSSQRIAPPPETSAVLQDTPPAPQASIRADGADIPAPPPWAHEIIQGGMGAGVSGWKLARAVSLTGHLGVVSGLGLDVMVTRQLQRGDPTGDYRRALAHFPIPRIAQQVIDRYFVEGGIGEGAPFRAIPQLVVHPSRESAQLAVVTNFAEIFLAKEGHDGSIGVNYLEKTQMATPAVVYGAMLAGVDYVLMGAGVPAEIPNLLDAFASGREGELTLAVHGGDAATAPSVSFSPESILGYAPPLARPRFLAIVSSTMLATYLSREDRTRPDGFVVEGISAGGHSAPPRGRLRLEDDGQPAYGPRDAVELATVRALGLPYWLAGGYSSPERLLEAKQTGAAGVQVGSAFALCAESGLVPAIRRSLRTAATARTLRVHADPRASPTGFPFKVAHLNGTLSDEAVYAERSRVCDVGYLRTPYRTASGRIGYRCPAEPIDDFVRKGGLPADAVDRRCLCNGLVSAIGLGQRLEDGATEPPIVTIGHDLTFLPHLIGDGDGADEYSAQQVIDYLTSRRGPAAV